MIKSLRKVTYYLGKLLLATLNRLVMDFTKKYWSEGEFKTKSGDPYSGYVGILDGDGYIYDTEEKLVKNDSYKTQVNASEYFFDRILDEEIRLPYQKNDVTFAANDFLSSSILKNIITKLQKNNDYIFRNTIISNTLVPNSQECFILATRENYYYNFVGQSGNEYEAATESNIQDIRNGFVINRNSASITTEESYPLMLGETAQEKYKDYYKVPNTIRKESLQNGTLKLYNLAEKKTTKTSLDSTFYPQIDKETGERKEPLYNFNDITHSEIIIKKIEDVGGVKKINLLVFLLFKTKILIFQYPLFIKDNKITQGEYPEISFSEGSNDILVLDKTDPFNKSSLKFLGLKDIEIHGNYMYLVDETLNMVLRYDIAYLLNDDSDSWYNTKSIRLLDLLQGDGTVNDEIYFNSPVSVAVDDNFIYIADQGNNCVKKYSSSFDYVATLRNGKFADHTIGSIAISPYSMSLEDGTVLSPGTLWIFSTTGTHMWITVMDGTNVAYSRQIDKIELLEDRYTWDEEFKSVKFSFSHSNYYYISTTKRVYKLHLSKPFYPFASLSYYKQRSLLSTMVWSAVPYPWHTLPDGTTDENVKITWAYRPQKTSAEILDNRAFCLCGNDSTTLIENSNSQEQFNGDIIFHIGNLYDQYSVDTYIKRNNVSFDQIPTEELAKMVKCSGLFLYLEQPTFISSVSNDSIPCYTTEDIQKIPDDEYVNPVTFNAHIYKLVYNLVNLKNIIIGTFQGAYNMDNIMVYDQIILDDFFQQLRIENNDDLLVHDNELASIIINRIFEKIFDLQDTILSHMKAKYIATPSFSNNTFRTI